MLCGQVADRDAKVHLDRFFGSCLSIHPSGIDYDR